MMTLQNDVDPAFLVGRHYRSSSLPDRLLIRLRPYICPFAPILEQVPRGSSVFDIGCGGGLWLMTLAESGRITHGLGCDISTQSMRKAIDAAAHYRRAGGDAELNFLHTLTSDAWPSLEKFDVVSLIDVLHHIPPAMQSNFLRAAIDRLKPGGRLIYKDMASNPVWAAVGNRVHDLVMARQWIHYFPIQDAIAVMKQSDCSIIHQDEWRRYFYAHEFVVAQKA
jgi:2-polyprenyl-3-methyl-5-hydroxy-6-metoxy-1,4-benzoquinol methylase